METVAIVGVGLIGGSFALALRKAGFAGRIIGVSSRRTIEEALAHEVVDEGLPIETALPQADLVYLSQPIRQILDTLDSIDPLLKPGVLVTDAGSTKVAIVERAREKVRKGQFLGGHPMAGKEKRGVGEAEPDLFAGCTYILTPTDELGMETRAAQEFVAWVRAIGANPISLAPDEHDRVVSFTSHLPQLASTALAATLMERLDAHTHAPFSGPGLRDTTRLSLSTFDIWGDILSTNSGPIEKALDAYISKLKEIRAGIASEGLRAEFEKGATFSSVLRREPE